MCHHYGIARKSVYKSSRSASPARVAWRPSRCVGSCRDNPRWGSMQTPTPSQGSPTSISWQKLCNTQHAAATFGSRSTEQFARFSILHLRFNKPKAFSTSTRPAFICRSKRILSTLPSAGLKLRNIYSRLG